MAKEKLVVVRTSSGGVSPMSGPMSKLLIILRERVLDQLVLDSYCTLEDSKRTLEVHLTPGNEALFFRRFGDLLTQALQAVQFEAGDTYREIQSLDPTFKDDPQEVDMDALLERLLGDG